MDGSHENGTLFLAGIFLVEGMGSPLCSEDMQDNLRWWFNAVYME